MPPNSEDPLRAQTYSAVTAPADPRTSCGEQRGATAGAPPTTQREGAGAWEISLHISVHAVFINTLILLDEPTTLRYSLIGTNNDPGLLPWRGPPEPGEVCGNLYMQDHMCWCVNFMEKKNRPPCGRISERDR